MVFMCASLPHACQKARSRSGLFAARDRALREAPPLRELAKRGASCGPRRQPWGKALLVPGNLQAQTLDRAKVPTVLGHQGNVDQDIAIDQVGHVTWWRKLSASKITSKTVDVFHAVDDVAPVFPYAVECEIPNRAGFALEAVSTRRYANLNNRPFDDAHILEGLEDAIFILCGDGHRLATGTLGQVDSRRYRIPYNIITPKMTAFGFLKCAAKCVTLSSFQL